MSRFDSSSTTSSPGSRTPPAPRTLRITSMTSSKGALRASRPARLVDPGKVDSRERYHAPAGVRPTVPVADGRGHGSPRPHPRDQLAVVHRSQPRCWHRSAGLERPDRVQPGRRHRPGRDPTDGSEAVLVGGDAQDDWPNYSRDGTMMEVRTRYQRPDPTRRGRRRWPRNPRCWRGSDALQRRTGDLVVTRFFGVAVRRRWTRHRPHRWRWRAPRLSTAVEVSNT